MKSNKMLIVVLISLVIIGASILVNFLSFSNIDGFIVGQLKENQLTETEYAADQIETHVRMVKDELVTLSKFPIMETLDVDKCSGDMKIIHENIESKIDSLLRVDSNGNIVECSSPDFSSYLGLNVKNKDYFKIPSETNEPFIDSTVKQGTNRQIIVSTPLFKTTQYTPYPNFVGGFEGELLSIIELNKLHDLYLHPIIRSGKNFFLLVNIGTGETILKSEGIGEYSDIKDFFPKNDNRNTVGNFGDMGRTIITSSDLIVGSEKWALFVLTPTKNVGQELNSVQKVHLFGLGFVIIVIITVFIFLIYLYGSKEKVQSKLDETNVTLEKLGIKIETEKKERYSQADINLSTKQVYLVKEDEENHAHELFISALNKGFAGLGIIREDPRKFKEKYNLVKTSFIWLSNTKVEGVPSEINIDNLFRLIAEFVKKSKKSVVLLDRLDYIITENKFEKVIKIIHDLKDLALAHDCVIILSVNPELVGESPLRAIEVETIDIYGRHLRKKVELADLEMDILKYVNEKNITNRLASYKDITENFKITKPTTRSKISRLQGLGLLQVEQRGRFKSLKITSLGRKIIP